jgi:hypothetical protein
MKIQEVGDGPDLARGLDIQGVPRLEARPVFGTLKRLRLLRLISAAKEWGLVHGEANAVL